MLFYIVARSPPPHFGYSHFLFTVFYLVCFYFAETQLFQSLIKIETQIKAKRRNWKSRVKMANIGLKSALLKGETRMWCGQLLRNKNVMPSQQLHTKLYCSTSSVRAAAFHTSSCQSAASSRTKVSIHLLYSRIFCIFARLHIMVPLKGCCLGTESIDYSGDCSCFKLKIEEEGLWFHFTKLASFFNRNLLLIVFSIVSMLFWNAVKTSFNISVQLCVDWKPRLLTCISLAPMQAEYASVQWYRKNCNMMWVSEVSACAIIGCWLIYCYFFYFRLPTGLGSCLI